MSWDIILFNSRQKIESVEDLYESKFQPTDFCTAFEDHFANINKDDNHREIRGIDFANDYFVDDEEVSNKMVSVYGENGLFELIELAKRQQWQIFDTALEQMIDLDDPAKNGYENFQRYLRQVFKK
jgi:hypothetical protein